MLNADAPNMNQPLDPAFDAGHRASREVSPNAAQTLTAEERAMEQQLGALGDRLVDLHRNIAPPEVIIPRQRESWFSGWVAITVKLSVATIVVLVLLFAGLSSFISSRLAVPIAPVVAPQVATNPPPEVERAIEHPTLANLRVIDSPEQTQWLERSRASTGTATMAPPSPRFADVLIGPSGPSPAATELISIPRQP
jgi:hypothetical protein